MKKTVVTLLALAFTAGNACSAFAAGPAGFARGLTGSSAVSYISEKGTIIPPFAQVLFCAQNPTECRDNNGLAVVAMTDKQMLQLKDVNTAVNRTMIGRNDSRNELNGDVWKVNVPSGDCEDFALTKRSRLIAMGWSSRALRIATAYTPPVKDMRSSSSEPTRAISSSTTGKAASRTGTIPICAGTRFNREQTPTSGTGYNSRGSDID